MGNDRWNIVRSAYVKGQALDSYVTRPCETGVSLQRHAGLFSPSEIAVVEKWAENEIFNETQVSLSTECL